MSIVSIVRCADYQPRRVRAAVEEVIRLAELERFFTPGTGVLLKPNLLSTRRPEEAVTTHPAIIQAIGEAAARGGCGLALGDSPPFAGENPARYAKLCDETGAAGVAEVLGARLLRFEEDVTTVAHPEGHFYRSFEVARAAVDAGVIVNIPKLKTHGLTALSGAVKNIFGCVPGIRKGLFHVQAAEDRGVFAQMLVDLAGVIRPDVHLMDAIVAMEGEGPNAGAPRQVGVVLASSDPVALDAVACAIVGIDPLSIDTTRLAHEQGIGVGKLASIQVRGETIDAVRVEGFKPSSGANDWARIPAPVRRIIRGQFVASPRIGAPECIGCGDCARVCPVNAITQGKPPSIDLTQCIRCYCCHEVCNLSAISLRRGWLGDLVFRFLRKG